MNYELKQDERLDDLYINGMKIIQNKQQFCFSTDAILLAEFALVKAKACAVDLGTGTGVIALLLAAQGAAKVRAVEINPIMAELAKRNAAMNGLEQVLSVECMDIRNIRQQWQAGWADLVVSNPPYRPAGNGPLSMGDGRAVARHELTVKLEDIVSSARYLLKHRGRFAMVHLPERLSEICIVMNKYGIEPKRLQFVQAAADSKPSMLLIEGIVGGAAGMSVEPSLVIGGEASGYNKALLLAMESNLTGR